MINRLLVLTFALTGITTAQQSPTAADTEIHLVPVRGNVYMLVGVGGNITVSIGRDGVLLVDTGRAEMADKTLAAIRQFQTQTASNNLEALGFGAEGRSALRAIVDTKQPPKPIRFIINTQADADHTGGNEKFVRAGKTYTGGNAATGIEDPEAGATILAHEKVLSRMAQIQPALPDAALPSDTYYVESKKLSEYFNGEGVEIIHLPAAHTDGDSLVWFRGSDVISTGDVFTPNLYPVIDLQRGGSVQGVLNALNRILDMTVPEFRLEGGTMLVPGHGHLSDAADLAYYRDMVTIIRDRIQASIKKDMTLEQIKAAKLTLDYDGIYGATSGPWTTDMFIEAVYKSLNQKK